MLRHQFPLVRPSDKAQLMQLWYWHLHHMQPLENRLEVVVPPSVTITKLHLKQILGILEGKKNPTTHFNAKKVFI